MKYTVSVIINRKREEVSDTLRSRKAAFEWMKGLKSFDLIEGKLEEDNSKYKMVFTNKGKETVMYETINRFAPPGVFDTTYTAGKVVNYCENKLIEQEDQTKYEMTTSFEFPFPMNLFIWMFKPMFKKETLKGMLDFKNYLEKE